MSATEKKDFNPFEGLSKKEIEIKLNQILSLSGAFFQESSDPNKMKQLAAEAIRKIQQNY